MNHLLRTGALASVCLAESAAFVLAAPVDETASTFYELNEAGQNAIAKRDYALSEHYFEKAKAAALNENHPEWIRDMDAQRSALYINAGEPSRAIFILEPYVGKDASNHMLADYLQALMLCGRFSDLTNAYKTYIANIPDFPVYGLQMAGDSYLRQKKYKEAIGVYESILSKTTVENAPYAQLGYAYSLAKLNKKDEAIAAYSKVANINERLNNIIISDAETFLADGRINIARKMFALLGITDKEKEDYSLRYANSLVNVSKDFQDDTLNYRRDEIMSDRSYNHEANKILKRLEKSDDEAIAHKASLVRADNFLNEEMYADAHKRLSSALSKDNKEPAALAVLGEYERLNFNSLETYYSTSMDDKRNHIQTLGVDYDTYLGDNFFLNAAVSKKWMEDDDINVSFWQESLGLTKHFENFRIKGEYLGYQNISSKHGYEFQASYDFNDIMKMTYSYGRRAHENPAAVDAGITEDYHEINIKHQLNHLTNLEGSYKYAKLSDDNKYKGYELSLTHLIRVKHNFSDRIILNYSHEAYDFESFYDSPWRRVEYGFTLGRKWNLPKQDAVLEMLLGFNWGHDNDEGTGFSPSVTLLYTKQFAHDQQLKVAAIYNRYFNQTYDPGKRKDAYGFSVSYNWNW